MDIVSTLTAILKSPLFYGGVLVLTLFSYATIRRFTRRIPFLKQKKMLMLVAGIGLASTLGLLASLGFGSTGSMTPGVWAISEVQITGLDDTNGGTVAVDGSNPYLINVRQTDAQANETALNYEVNQSTFTIQRTGELVADSCRVCISSAEYIKNEVTGQDGTNPYNILEKDVAGRYKTYLNDASTAPTTTDSQGCANVAFAEGVASETFTMIVNVDEESHDALLQYSSRDATLDICGFPVVLSFRRMD